MLVIARPFVDKSNPAGDLIGRREDVSTTSTSSNGQATKERRFPLFVSYLRAARVPPFQSSSQNAALSFPRQFFYSLSFLFSSVVWTEIFARREKLFACNFNVDFVISMIKDWRVNSFHPFAFEIDTILFGVSREGKEINFVYAR